MKKTLPGISILVFATLACNISLPQTEATQAPALPVATTQAVSQGQSDLPQTEAAVPRVSVEDAKAALDSGEAIIVDVRSSESYAAEHAAGAISIPLELIEGNPAGLDLDKTRWIITYCT
ncbi:MAG: rhodanese-like domain-containing protein [Chloroflexi bacterium]|nr:rhodanese-like domain-containing protein [Chloroflexota bacterium]